MNLGMETEYLEFKRSTSELKEAMLSICAMLNKHQRGELYFGVKNDGTVIGQMVTEDTLRDISQKIQTSIEPRIYADVKLINLDGKSCIHVSFEGNDTPYFTNGIAKIRMSDEDITISPLKLSEIYRKKYTQFGVWELLVSKKTIDEVDEDLLNRYILQAKNSGRIVIDFTNKETVLNQLELVDGKFLLNAGKVLFSSEITQDLQMAIFATTERLTFNDIQRYHGPILRLVDIAENYIKSNIHWGVEFDGTMQRKEVPEIPINAIREALLNSFCHKDFSAGESNEVAIYKDRIEIYNPGEFPEGFEPENFIDDSLRSIRRNPLIARILYFSKDIESFGTGLKRIKEECDRAKVRYKFKKIKGGFIVCFYRPSYKSLQVAPQVAPQVELLDNQQVPTTEHVLQNQI